MTDYIKNFGSENDMLRGEAERLAEKLKTDTTFKGGVIRWKMGNLCPTDCAEFAKFLGLAVDLDAQQAARDKQLDEMVKRMKRNEKNMSEEARAEQAYEMRAAFGPGVTVVNIFTGRKTRT